MVILLTLGKSRLMAVLTVLYYAIPYYTVLTILTMLTTLCYTILYYTILLTILTILYDTIY